VSVITGYAVTI